ncbi:MAG: hypothetical protein EBX99_03555 [Acidimicrobiia bacterium]|nr:hypothetical protein [Acidimicrobiia bacterium]
MSTLAEQRRGHELRLVIFAGIITAAAYTLASLGQNSEIPPRILPFLGFLLLILMSAHIAVRLLAPGADGTLRRWDPETSGESIGIVEFALPGRDRDGVPGEPSGVVGRVTGEAGIAHNGRA